MKAFHDKEEVKNFYLARVCAHRVADEIIHGQYWEEGKRCAVGCTIHSDNHNAYESELGIPEWLARVEDCVFEGLPNKRSMLWPEKFLSAIKPGVDLEKIKTPFLIFVLESCLESMALVELDANKFPEVQNALDGSKSAVLEMIRCHKKGLDLLGAVEAARSAAAARSASVVASLKWSASVAKSPSAAYVKYADKILELIGGL